LERKNVDASLSSFLKSLTNIVLNFILIIVVVGILGIETSSFVALFASAGVAIGMALSGTLQNFAGGVMILLFRPFKVGDFIEVMGVSGTVKEIQIFNTLIVTPDNKVIITPNGSLSTSVMTNYSKEDRRRVDFEFGIAYGDDYDKAKSVLMQIINANDKIIKNEEGKEPFIALTKLDASSVNIVVRVWVNPADYWAVNFKMNEDVYKEFSKQGLNIPFPQMDVHVISQN
jgi:small conductance mechanosensitive channel